LARLPLTTLVCLLVLLALAAGSGLSWWFLLLPLLARLMAIDLHLRVLPDVYTLPLLGLGLLTGGPQGTVADAWLGLGLVVLICLAIGGLAWLIRRQPSTLGGGDVKLMAVTGALVGWQLLPFSLMTAAVLSVPLFLIWRGQAVPFGPGLVVALTFFLFWA
jgi:prepilin signal peptidase PulO-like enzyme (type II secretory pathway)